MSIEFNKAYLGFAINLYQKMTAGEFLSAYGGTSQASMHPPETEGLAINFRGHNGTIEWFPHGTFPEDMTTLTWGKIFLMCEQGWAFDIVPEEPLTSFRFTSIRIDNSNVFECIGLLRNRIDLTEVNVTFIDPVENLFEPSAVSADDKEKPQ